MSYYLTQYTHEFIISHKYTLSYYLTQITLSYYLTQISHELLSHTHHS